MAEVKVQIAFRSDPSKYSFAGSARLINAYAEKQGDDAKAPLVVLPRPGLISCCEVTDTVNRGNIFLDDLDCGYTVHSSGVFKYTKTSDSPFTLAATRIGTLPGIDQVQMSRNQADPVQISIHCDAGDYYIEADTVKIVDDLDLPETVTSEYVKGYTVYGIEDGRFFFTSINECQTIDPLDFATAEQYADKLVRIIADGSDMLVFSHTSIEPWRVTGDADLPFQLVGGSVSKKGLVAVHGPVSCDNTIMFPGEDNIFYRLNGYTPQRISTHGIERLLEADTDRESMQSFSYTFEGHSFAIWNGSNYTVAFDAATSVWHEWQSYNLTNSRARNAVRAWGKTIVGDSQSGELLYFDSDTFTEDGQPLIWGMDTAFLHTFPNGGIVDALYIDIATGVGALLASAEGYDPILMLSWSVDGGQTFKGNRQLKLGKRGAATTRLVARRLGKFSDKGIMFRLRISDPVIRGIVEMSAKIRPLAR